MVQPTHLALIVSLLVVFAGAGLYAGVNCANLTGEAEWDLAVHPYDETGYQNGSFVFDGVVYIGGSTGAPDIRNGSLVFYDEEDDRMDSVPIGDFGINAQNERNVTTRLSERPHRIEIHGEVNAEPDTEWSVVGLEWTGERYEMVTLQSDPEPWYC